MKEDKWENPRLNKETFSFSLKLSYIISNFHTQWPDMKLISYVEDNDFIFEVNSISPTKRTKAHKWLKTLIDSIDKY